MVAVATPPVREEIFRGTGTREFLHLPVNRTGGNMGLRVHADPSTGRYASARAGANFYRGFEQILAGRDFRDAIFIASRCCGYHGGQHAIAAAQAVEMALGIDPPPMAVAVRNLGL